MTDDKPMSAEERVDRLTEAWNFNPGERQVIEEALRDHAAEAVEAEPERLEAEHQELRLQIDRDWRTKIDRLRARVAALEAREARLVAALEFYADPNNYGSKTYLAEGGSVTISERGPIDCDRGKRARAELDAVKGESDDG